MSKAPSEVDDAPMYCLSFHRSAHQELSSHVIVNIAWHHNLQDHVSAVSNS